MSVGENRETDDLGNPASETGGGAPDECAPIEFQGYTLQRELTRGGQAVIFLATQNSTGRRVAIKVLFGGRLASPVEKTRMDQEVRILAALDHPNIVSIIDRGETPDGSAYFVMEYVEGRTLNEYLDDYREQYGPPEATRDVTDLLRLFIRVCEAVNAAHLRGIVHRDLKPSNVIIDSYGEPHILDFGLARNPLPVVRDEATGQPVTRTGEFVGSMQWASPEQAEGVVSKIDIRSDVYALGVLLYEMLTGEFPYDVFGSVREVLNNIVNSKPLPPSRALEARRQEAAAAKTGPRDKFVNPIDPELDRILLKALAKNQDQRYQSASELSKDLSRYLSATRFSEAAVRSARRSRRAAYAVAGAAGVLVAAAVLWGAARRGQSRWAAATRPAEGPNVVGYTLDKRNVVFEFVPARYDTVRFTDGKLDRLASITDISKVVVAGEFNNWARGASEKGWVMTRQENGVFTLTRSLSAFQGRARWPFKFVVNDVAWVGAPQDADNREIVATDTATYNLILVNPLVQADTATQVLDFYRRQINTNWPGQGANLALNEAGYHFTFTHLPPRVRVTDLTPLEGIPLASLNLGDTKVTDFTPLRDMRTLKALICSDGTYGYLLAPVYEALWGGRYDAARQAADRMLGELTNVPALVGARAIILQSITNLEALARAPGQVPPQAALFQGHSYVLNLLPQNWKDAQAFAERHGAHLATVTSREEQEWLQTAYGLPSLGRSFWLGGTDEHAEGYWRWITGEPWRFENWTSPEPNNGDGSEHALAMKYDGWWIDANGEQLRLPFFIEWDHQ